MRTRKWRIMFHGKYGEMWWGIVNGETERNAVNSAWDKFYEKEEFVPMKVVTIVIYEIREGK